MQGWQRRLSLCRACSHAQGQCVRTSRRRKRNETRNGRNDVALMIMQARTPPSYIYMVLQGATTLWETWYSTRYDPGGTARCEAGCGVPSWNRKF